MLAWQKQMLENGGWDTSTENGRQLSRVVLERVCSPVGGADGLRPYRMSVQDLIL